MASPLTVYAGSPDGYLWNQLIDNTWADMRAMSTGSVAAGDSALGILAENYNLDGTQYTSVNRIFLAFDCTGVGSPVTAASIFLKTQSGGCTMKVYEGTQSNPEALAQADWNNFGATTLTATITAAAAGSYTEFPLNASGLSLIVSGWCKYAILEALYDATGNDPSGNSAASYFYSSETSGTGSDPYIVVTYTEGGSSYVPVFLLQSRSNIGRSAIPLN